MGNELGDLLSVNVADEDSRGKVGHDCQYDDSYNEVRLVGLVIARLGYIHAEDGLLL